MLIERAKNMMENSGFDVEIKINCTDHIGVEFTRYTVTGRKGKYFVTNTTDWCVPGDKISVHPNNWCAGEDTSIIIGRVNLKRAVAYCLSR